MQLRTKLRLRTQITRKAGVETGWFLVTHQDSDTRPAQGGRGHLKIFYPHKKETKLWKTLFSKVYLCK